jgi:hypothetical protein
LWICWRNRHPHSQNIKKIVNDLISRKERNMNDLISRQAAIDVVKGIDRSFVKYIEELPSAQPDERMLHESCELDTGDRTQQAGTRMKTTGFAQMQK